VRFFRISCAALTVSIFSWCLSANCQQLSPASSQSAQIAPLSAAQIAKNLEERDQQRAAALQQFSGRRIYRMQYRGWPSNRDAEMVVDMTYRAPNVKEFKIISQSGSTFVVDHIFKKLMLSEQQFISDQNRRETALSTENYNFTFAGYEVTPSGSEYVLNIAPKKNNKFLYRGKIWVDGKDFAVVQIEAEPSESPSIWIKKTEIEHRYMKVNDFWLPAADRTESAIRLGGEATLSIEYQDYKITRNTPPHGIELERAGMNSR
jgi:outer membrane lipoprotein-sorting protein